MSRLCALATLALCCGLTTVGRADLPRVYRLARALSTPMPGSGLRPGTPARWFGAAL